MFPDHFMWGAATSAYQIEGAYLEDGKGLNVWDVFVRQAGTVYHGDTGDVACDHYHRYQEDIGLMQEIGLQAYRFSVNWARVLPAGIGQVNQAGLDFYDRLVDALLAANIMPFATLYHWDLPYALHTQGGWLNRDSADWFAEYTRVMVQKLGDRLKHWMTFNEPAVFINMGMGTGEHAPGLKLPPEEVFRSAHHVLLAHGKSMPIIREYVSDCVAGIVHTGEVTIPVSDADQTHAKDVMFASEQVNFWKYHWWMDPTVKGEYPNAELVPEGIIQADDMGIIQQPLDFMGLNIYTGTRVGGESDLGHPVTLFHWKVEPDSLYWGAKWIHERYNLPIYITENGLANPDWVHVDGKVHDPQRIDFLHRYLSGLGRAAKEGVDLRGYFQWSLLDNFEWAEGMKHRFGLVYVDYQTQERILKDSASWYRSVIESNGANLS